jgi:polyisoprenoid-binding protein YceI
MNTKAVAVALALFVMAAPVSAQNLIPSKSEIAFTSRQMGVPVDGTFKKFSAQLLFNPKRPQEAKLAFVIDLASVAFGAPETDTEIAKPDWFDTRQFPQAVFQSTVVRAMGPDKFEVSGKLSLKGTSREIIIPFTLTPGESETLASGTFHLKRLEFNIGAGEWKDTTMVANEVQVRFRLAISGMPKT